MSIRKNKTFQKAVHNKSIVIGLIMVLIVILIAVFALLTWKRWIWAMRFRFRERTISLGRTSMEGI